MTTSTPYSRRLLDMIKKHGSLDTNNCDPKPVKIKKRKLSKKNKTLIQLGIAVVLRCDNLIIDNIENASCAGANSQEIMTTINTAIEMISLSGGAPSFDYSDQVKDYLQDHKSINKP